MPLLVVIIGLLLAAWMNAGHALFGLGSDLTVWYLIIGVTYSLCSIWLSRRIVKARTRVASPTRPVVVLSVLSWVCAVAFGFTVPGRNGAHLDSIVSLYGGEFWREMSIALCNPFGILAFTFLGGAIGVAIANSREPRLSEDEILDRLEAERQQAAEGTAP